MKKYLEKSNSIEWFNLKSEHTKTFHMTWIAFFISFLAWFGIAPLMVIIRNELHLTDQQVTYSIIASVTGTVLSRIVIGWLCDYYGPRRVFASLLFLASIPIASVVFIHDFYSLMIIRFFIGVIGASFVINQFHITSIYHSTCVGTASATGAGWGNLGGGVSQILMPTLFSGFLYFGFSEFWSWRLPLICISFFCIVTGILYLKVTSDPIISKSSSSTKLKAWKNRDVWLLFLAYGASFGVELTINNIAVLYFTDNFSISLGYAGLIASLFGAMNIFARSLGGYISDKISIRYQNFGRYTWLVCILSMEAITIFLFSQLHVLTEAIVGLICFSLCVQMSQGATFAIVPSISPQNSGKFIGIIGAGGNIGAILAGFLFISNPTEWRNSLFYLSISVFIIAILNLGLFFPSKKDAHISSSQTVKGIS